MQINSDLVQQDDFRLIFYNNENLKAYDIIFRLKNKQSKFEKYVF